jgi:hypothetical protein
MDWKLQPNGLRYPQVGGLGFCLGSEKTRSQKNACKSRRLPLVGCTLCWHAFDLQESLAYFIFTLFRIGQMPALFVSSTHEHFLNSMNLVDFVNHKRIARLGCQRLYHLPSQHGLQVKHYEFLLPYA